MSTEAQRIAMQERRDAMRERYRAEVLDAMEHVIEDYRLKKFDAKDALDFVRALLREVTP